VLMSLFHVLCVIQIVVAVVVVVVVVDAKSGDGEVGNI